MNTKNKSIFDSGAGYILLIIGLLTSLVIVNDMKHQHFYKNKLQEIMQLQEEHSEKYHIETKSSVLQINFLQRYISNAYDLKERESAEGDENTSVFLISHLKNAVQWVDQQKERAANLQ
ncbi:MAG: hypothetical protein JJU28_16865 [Cyclobacteriaceae bacterium]|nr:hypothetical protein [Cyclobacteriaceae bacterium]